MSTGATTDSQLPLGVGASSSRHGILFIISGPSGAGKGTLVNRVLASLASLRVSVSATTRAPRANEQDGREYFFLTRQRFNALVAEDGFLEWAEVYGNCYGTPRKNVADQLEQGCDLILEIDVQGREQVIGRMPEAVSIFIAPPSLEVLERRLRRRGSDSNEAIQRRLQTAKIELEKAQSYDYCIVNNELEQAAVKLEHIIASYR